MAKPSELRWLSTSLIYSKTLAGAASANGSNVLNRLPVLLNSDPCTVERMLSAPPWPWFSIIKVCEKAGVLSLRSTGFSVLLLRSLVLEHNLPAIKVFYI